MSLEFWRNVAVVVISIQLALLCLVPVGLLLIAVHGMNRVLDGASSGLHRLQEASGRTRVRAEETAAQMSSAAVQVHSKAERVQATFRQLLERGGPGADDAAGRGGSSPE